MSYSFRVQMDNNSFSKMEVRRKMRNGGCVRTVEIEISVMGRSFSIAPASIKVKRTEAPFQSRGQNVRPHEPRKSPRHIETPFSWPITANISSLQSETGVRQDYSATVSREHPSKRMQLRVVTERSAACVMSKQRSWCVSSCHSSAVAYHLPCEDFHYPRCYRTYRSTLIRGLPTRSRSVSFS